MSRAKNVFSGITFGVINNVLNMLLPFISRTIIIRQLGVEYVGLKGIFTSILQVLSLSELGFGAAIGYLLYKPLAEHDVIKVNAILKLYRKIYRIIGAAIFLISIILLPFLNKLISGDVPEGISIYILYFIYVANTIVSYFFFAYKKILLSANQRYDIEVSINSMVLIIQNIFQIIVLLAFKNYYIYVLVIPIMTVLNNIVSYVIVNKRYPEYKCEGFLEKSEYKGILSNTGGAFFSKIGSTVYLSVDNIVISAFLGLIVLGVYDNYFYVVSSLVAIYAVIHNALRPVIGNVIVVETKEKAWRIFRGVNYTYMLFVVVCSTCLLFLFQDFERLWCGPDIMLGINMVVLFSVYFFVGRMGAILSVFQEAAGLFWEGKFIPLVSAIVNLTINIILVKIIGLSGILISSIVSALFISFPGYAYIVFNHLFIEPSYRKRFFNDNIWIIIQLIISVSVVFLISNMIKVSGWGMLIVKGGIVFAVTCMIILIFNYKNELVKEMINYAKTRFLKKKKRQKNADE